ncbi:MAG TPA: DUF6113 family protein [Nocardioidaceae bacterium]|nr:DUF6113 family protein [Nocardioidaceae bacterium]
MPTGAVARGLGLLAAVVVGSVLALVAVALHRMVWRSEAISLPWGLALGVAASVLCGLAAGLLLGRRAGTLALAAGWVLTVYWLLRGRPEGDYLVAGDALGWGFLATGVAAMAVLVGASLTSRRPPG